MENKDNQNQSEAPDNNTGHSEEGTETSPTTEGRQLSDQEKKDLRCAVEALVFANGDPISMEDLKQALESRFSGISENDITDSISELKECFLSNEQTALSLIEVAGKYQFRTKPEYAQFISSLKADKPRRLSPAALETLAIIAYRQPVLKSDIEKIRGVDVSPTLKTLLERELVHIAGYQTTAGQPALYATSEEFLKVFGISSLKDLPNLNELIDPQVLRDIKEQIDSPGS